MEKFYSRKSLSPKKKSIAVVGKLSVASLWRLIDDQENIFLKFFIEVFGAVSELWVRFTNRGYFRKMQHQKRLFKVVCGTELMIVSRSWCHFIE